MGIFNKLQSFLGSLFTASKDKLNENDSKQFKEL